jgi:archaellum biogenesis ATPase FlaH
MTAITPATNRLLDAALALAAINWRVIPLTWPEGVAGTKLTCSCAQPDCDSPAKHPLTENGLKDASADETVIRGWWKRWPRANVGIVTGAESGIVVLDKDLRHGGEETLAKLMDEYGEFSETVEAVTGGGGAHFIFAHPGKRVKNSVGKNGWLAAPGLDIRGDGGYIVAAPSLHIEGQRYRWLGQSSPFDIDPAVMPDWLLARMDKPRPATEPGAFAPTDNARRWLGKALAKAYYGNRNDTGFWLAQQLRDGNIPFPYAETTMRDYAARVPGGEKKYGEAEALASLRSAYSAPARAPARSFSTIAKTTVPAIAVTGAAAELRDYLRGVVDRTIFNVPWPWPLTTRLTQALLPGSITMIVGDPGVGKTFLVLQCLQYWHGNAYSPAVFFIEKSRRFHSMRLLAQLEDKGCYVDHEWIKNNEREIGAAMERNSAMLDELGKCIHSAPLARVTLQSLLGWIRQMASAGKRVIVVDPITAISAGNERWTKDEDFVIEAQQICEAHGCSLVLMTHPKKGNRPGNPTLHDQAGGAAYSRFTDTDIWIHRPAKLKQVEFVDQYHLRGSGTFGQFFQLHKTRNGKGAGRELAFVFGEGLAYAEQGVVKREIKDKKTDPAGQGEAA